MKKNTPLDLNYRMPAEWEKHAATWLGWPHNREDWPGKISPIPWVYGEMVRKISEDEYVHIVVESKKHQQNAERVLIAVGVDLTKIKFFILKTDRGWMRDSGPAFIKNDSGEVALANFKFNAWAKYSNY